jgi:pyruvate kinase
MAYEIIATLGPSSSEPAIWHEMLSAGATAFRLNTSHLSLPQLAGWLDRLLPFLAAQPGIPLTLDLQGSKWRVGQFPSFDLDSGQKVDLVYGDASSQPGTLPVPHADFFQAAAQSTGEIVLNDAKIRLRLESSGPDWMQARVLQGGPISAHKGITYTASDFRSESISAKDQAILEQTRALETIRYAISYIKDAEEMARYRACFGKEAYLAAKIERRPAVDEPEQVCAFADELWLCRGDLGAELGLAGMAEAVHRFSAVPAALSKPVILAGQVLEHLVDHPTPTRSEVTYLYDSLLRGYRGVVLSDETAVGRYPVEACRAAAIFEDVL